MGVSPSEARAGVGSRAEALGLGGLGRQEPSQLSTVCGDRETVAESGQKPDLGLPQLNSRCLGAAPPSAGSREKLVSFSSFQRPLPCLGWWPLPPSSRAAGLHLYDPLLGSKRCTSSSEPLLPSTLRTLVVLSPRAPPPRPSQYSRIISLPEGPLMSKLSPIGA